MEDVGSRLIGSRFRMVKKPRITLPEKEMARKDKINSRFLRFYKGIENLADEGT